MKLDTDSVMILCKIDRHDYQIRLFTTQTKQTLKQFFQQFVTKCNGTLRTHSSLLPHCLHALG